MTYFNTTGQSGTALTKFKRAAANQDELILAWFKKNRRKKMTPYDIKRAAILNRRTPIDSIRRSINSLTKVGGLVKLDEKLKEVFGRENHLWKLKTA